MIATATDTSNGPHNDTCHYLGLHILATAPDIPVRYTYSASSLLQSAGVSEGRVRGTDVVGSNSKQAAVDPAIWISMHRNELVQLCIHTCKRKVKYSYKKYIDRLI